MPGSALIVGSTGNVGRSVVEGLAALQTPVKAASRKPTRSTTGDVQPVRFDFRDPTTFGLALEGVDRLFMVVPTGETAPYDLVMPFLAAATREKNRKIVLMTAAGVEHDEGGAYRRIELAVEKSGNPWVFLRPNWFMDNFHNYWRRPIQEDGAIPVPAGTARTAFIDARDIAASALAALQSTAFERRAFTLTGPESLNYSEAAAILSAAAQRVIRYAPVDDRAFVALLRAGGTPAAYAQMMVALFDFVRQGAFAATSPHVQTLTGRSPRSLSDYARDHASEWKEVPAATRVP